MIDARLLGLVLHALILNKRVAEISVRVNSSLFRNEMQREWCIICINPL
jgi:hypothetical protein